MSGHDDHTDAGQQRQGDGDRLVIAQQTVRDLWGIELPLAAEPGEPANIEDLRRLAMEHAFTDSWPRPGLDARTKSLMTISMLVGLGCHRTLRMHVSGALMLGITREEIIELFIHAAAYCGLPRTSEAVDQVKSLLERPPDAPVESRTSD